MKNDLPNKYQPKTFLRKAREQVVLAMPESREKSIVLARIDEALLYMIDDADLCAAIEQFDIAEARFAENGIAPHHRERNAGLCNVLYLTPLFDVDMDHPKVVAYEKQRLDPTGWFPDDLFEML